MDITRQWFWLIMFAVVSVLVYLLGPILTPFLAGILLSYLANPLVNKLQQWHLPRTLAVVAIFFGLAVLFGFLLLRLVPMLEKQISILLAKIPEMLVWLQQVVIPWIAAKLELKGILEADGGLNTDSVSQILQQHWQKAGNWFVSFLSSATQSGKSLLLWLANLLLIPVVMFYLLRDWPQLLEKIRQLIPPANEPTIVGLAQDCDEVVGTFFRGQLIVMLALATIYTFGLWMVGLELAMLIGLLAGLVSIVPYLGVIVGLGAAIIASLFQFADFSHVMYVVIVFTIGQMLESMVLTPLLVGDRIGLHPVAVNFAIMAGGQLFGFVGVLLALPVAAVLVVLLRHLKKRYLQSTVYQFPSAESS